MNTPNALNNVKMYLMPHKLLRQVFTTLFAILFATALMTMAAFANQTSEGALPAELASSMPAADMAGKGKLTFFGLDVYESKLWTGANFKSAGFDNHNFALELHYLRNFSAADIAKRSIDEMQRIEPVPEQKAVAWLKTLTEAIPNVKKGDRLVGVHKPGVGLTFWYNGKKSSEIRDAEFSRQFFGIWLSPKTSEPKLRTALLGKNTP